MFLSGQESFVSCVEIDWSKNCWVPCSISSTRNETRSKLSNVHTVQEAAEMFANASTDSKSPEQLCLLSFLSTSAHHSRRDPHGDTYYYPNISAPRVTMQVPTMVYKKKKNCKTVKQNGSPPFCRGLWTFTEKTTTLHWNQNTSTQIKIQLTFKNTFKSTLTHVHTPICHMCVCSGGMPKWESMLRQDQSPSGSVSITCECMSFLDRKNIKCP